MRSQSAVFGFVVICSKNDTINYRAMMKKGARVFRALNAK
jgi:hypothetical protein